MRRAAELLPAATPGDKGWMAGAAIVSLRQAEAVEWSPVAGLSESIPEDMVILAGIPPECKKATINRQWFALRVPIIPPELATVTRDYAYFSALLWVAERLETPWDPLIGRLTRSDTFTRRALERYTTFRRKREAERN